MSALLERLEPIALTAVAEILWPVAQFPQLTTDARRVSVSRLLGAQDARVCRYYQAILAAVAEGVAEELGQVHAQLLTPARRS